MTTVVTTTDRGSRRPVDKFEERRRELADAALVTLSERGYARTSLREIAQNSPFSHGVLHYYFRDKVELITYCVRRYKAVCVQRYDVVVDSSRSAGELVEGLASAMADTVVADADMHRLWYDLRSQALFEESFRDDVLEIDASMRAMIWRVVTRYAELAGAKPLLGEAAAYGAFDGVFQYALLRHLAGVPDADDDLRTAARQLLPMTVTLP